MVYFCPALTCESLFTPFYKLNFFWQIPLLFFFLVSDDSDENV